ncbi:MAG: efflux RND transporter permease subunit [Geminicoccaceae bacterium]
MSGINLAIDRLAAGLTAAVIRFRWLVISIVILAVMAVGSGARFLDFATDYRVFFSAQNPELVAFETFQQTYTKNDNFLFVVQPRDGQVFGPEVAEAVERITTEAWQIPFNLRVDSISNFQHSWADGDDLTVEDLIRNGAELSEDLLLQKRAVALAEPLLKDNLISADADTTGINVVLQYPQESLEEVPAAVEVARGIVAGIEADYPDLTVALSGISMLNNSFSESALQDMATLVPLMYATLLIVLLVSLRSLTGTFATFLVIIFSTIATMGAAGFMGVRLTPISMIAPTIIMTLAIADSVHILISLRDAMRKGMDKIEALIEAIRVNFLAIGITSVTTIIGFLALNFSDSPPFHHLGNMTAIGIFAAWIVSLTILPAVVSLLPVRFKAESQSKAGLGAGLLERLADLVIARYRATLLLCGGAAVLLTALVPTIALDDQWTKYFDERIEFRRDTDFAMANLGGLYPIEFSMEAADVGGVSDPDFLERLGVFTDWLRAQPEVTHVYSLADIMKRLNKNMHGDDEAYYTLPEDRDLAAQYLLLYELSLPYGLDLNDRIDIDKSATRVTATLGDVSTVETRVFLERAEAWLRDNTPAHMHANPTGATVMFSYIAERNIVSMLKGNAIAILLISAIMILALRSWSLGLLSLLPNAIPILMTFGVWAALVGVVGMAAATVAAVSLGIIVDNTVHLLTKYQRGLKENGLTTPDAIRYAFRTVGMAVAVNAIVLAFGFAVLTLSTFKINNELGMLMALTVIIALIVDFLLLPALLMFGSGVKKGEIDAHPQPVAAS